MAGAQKKKWALDTNVVLDLGRKVDAALSLWELSVERRYSLHITPTAFEELASLSESEDTATRKAALTSLENFQTLGYPLLRLALVGT
jgi:predicted nucleic acid-binding protein